MDRWEAHIGLDWKTKVSEVWRKNVSELEHTDILTSRVQGHNNNDKYLFW